MNSIHRTDNSGNSKISFIDAKQRAIWSVSSKTEGGKSAENTIVCAEPSPDALAVISSNLGFNASKDDIQAAFNAAMAEGASTIGIRTSSIQLLRDAMYRACEAHASGALNTSDYAQLTKRYQKSMVTLLAIEQLTSAVYPPSVTLNSTSHSEYNRQIADANKVRITARDHLAQTKEKLAAAKKDLEEKSKTYKETATPLDEAQAAAEGKQCDTTDKELKECKTLAKSKSAKDQEDSATETVKTLTAEQANAIEDLAAAKKVFDQMKEPVRDVAVTGKFHTNSSNAQSTDMSQIANTVQTMVRDVHNAEIIEHCFNDNIFDALKEIGISNAEIKALFETNKPDNKKQTIKDVLIARYQAQAFLCTQHFNSALLSPSD